MPHGPFTRGPCVPGLGAHSRAPIAAARVETGSREPLLVDVVCEVTQEICDRAVISRLRTSHGIADFELEIGRGPGI